MENLFDRVPELPKHLLTVSGVVKEIMHASRLKFAKDLRMMSSSPRRAL